MRDFPARPPSPAAPLLRLMVWAALLLATSICSTLVCFTLVCPTSAFAQEASAQTSDPPEVINAKSAIERLKSQVAAGAVAPAQLVQAEAALADAEDAAYLRKTLYGVELTEDQCDRMMAAANRRFERRK